MITKNFTFAAGALALGLATLVTPIKAQGPLYDRVYVNLPYTVTLGDKTLQPGNYVIQELPSQDKSRVLDIYTDNGLKFETSAMTIPAYDVNTPDNTTVTLHHFGNDYYFDKVMIQGKNYGYEFPLPNSVKQREKEALAPVSVAARYEAAPAQQPQTAQAAPAPSQPQAAEQPQVAEQPQTQPEQSQPEVAQNTPPPSPAPTQEAQPAPTPEAQPAPAPEANRELPTTSADWLSMLLGGGALSGLGLMLRRKR
jgi:LPXTG-motif cell wall-anchored protein